MVGSLYVENTFLKSLMGGEKGVTPTSSQQRDLGSGDKGCGGVEGSVKAFAKRARGIEVQLLLKAERIPGRRNCQQRDGVGKAKNVYSGNVWQKDCGSAAPAPAYSRPPEGMAEVKGRRIES
jgi:hypothetical protein